MDTIIQLSCLFANPIVVYRYGFLFNCKVLSEASDSKIVSEYDQEIPQSQTADNPVTPQGRATRPSRDTRKTIK